MVAPVTVPLVGESTSVTLNGSGNGMAKIGPISSREVWSPDKAHVSANIGLVTNEASCQIYVGQQVNANSFRDGTLSGSSGDSTDRISSDILHCGDYIFAVWVGGDAGVIATLSVTGTKTI